MHKTNKQNIRNIFGLVACGLILSSAIACLIIFCDLRLKCRLLQDDSIGIVCQVITAIAACLASIIAISMSLQNDECLGIPVKKFNNLRVALIDLFYDKPLNEQNTYFLGLLSTPKTLNKDYLVNDIGKWLYYEGAHFRTEESYQEALNKFYLSVSEYAPNYNWGEKIEAKRKYYQQLFRCS